LAGKNRAKREKGSPISRGIWTKDSRVSLEGNGTTKHLLRAFTRGSDGKKNKDEKVDGRGSVVGASEEPRPSLKRSKKKEGGGGRLCRFKDGGGMRGAKGSHPKQGPSSGGAEKRREKVGSKRSSRFAEEGNTWFLTAVADCLEIFLSPEGYWFKRGKNSGVRGESARGKITRRRLRDGKQRGNPPICREPRGNEVEGGRFSYIDVS